MASKSLYKNTVHEIQRYQTYILSVILGGLIVVIALASTIYDNMTFVSHVIEQTNPQDADAVAIEFTLPPPEEEKKQEDIQQLINKDIPPPNVENNVQDQNAEEGKTNSIGGGEEDSKINTVKNTQSAAEEVRDFERRLFEEAQGNSQRADIQKQREEIQRKKQKFEDDQKNKAKGNGQTANTTSSKKGKTMVSYHLTDRKPHNNDIANIRNPGYTCEQGSYGEITIKIKVNNLGQVESATPSSSYSGLNPCLVEQALKYARLSRFNASDKTSQDGTITYIFMP